MTSALVGKSASGTQFTGFTGTKVQMLTPEALRARSAERNRRKQNIVLSLLALLVQEYRYGHLRRCLLAGSLIKQYEAVHGTAAGMWRAHLAGNETSLNPLGMVEALIEALLYSVVRNDGRPAVRCIQIFYYQAAILYYQAEIFCHAGAGGLLPSAAAMLAPRICQRAGHARCCRPFWPHNRAFC